MENHKEKTIEKNGKRFTIRLSVLQSIVVIIATTISIVVFSFMPYKAFTDFANESKTDRDKIREVACLADSLARMGMKYSIENNFNMKLYFELGQPKNFNWTEYSDLKKKLYLDLP